MKLFPIREAWAGAKAYMDEGFEIYQQFECENCKTKQTMDVADKFYTHGTCQECKHITNIMRNGCNYMAIGRNVPITEWPPKPSRN